MLLPAAEGKPMNLLFAATGVVMLIELNTMHMGLSQPAHEPAPVVFRLFTVMLHEKYSVFATRSASAVAGTAIASFRRRCDSVSARSMLPISLLYAPMPPADCPAAQSTHTTSVGFCSTFEPSEFCRHVPMSRNSHHAGSTGSAVSTSSTSSLPETVVRSVFSMNDVTSTLVPVLSVQAEVRLLVPVPSPWQLDQDM